MNSPYHTLIDEVCRENAVLLRLLGVDSLPADRQLSAALSASPPPSELLDIYESLDERNLALRAEVARCRPDIDLQEVLDTELSKAA